MFRCAWLVTLLAMILLLALACGDDDDDGATATASPRTEDTATPDGDKYTPPQEETPAGTGPTRSPSADVTPAVAPDDQSAFLAQFSNPETGGQCSNTADDDGDKAVNEGCSQSGSESESGNQCSNASDDDGDQAANDGCPSGEIFFADCVFNPYPAVIDCSGEKYAVDPPLSGQDVSCEIGIMNGQAGLIHCTSLEPRTSIYYDIQN